MSIIERKSEQFSPYKNQKSQVNKILHHVDLEQRNRNNSFDGQIRFRQKMMPLQSNGNSPKQHVFQSSPKFQENDSSLLKQFSNYSNSLSNLVINKSTGDASGIQSSSSNPNGMNRFNNFQSFSPLQRDNLQEDYLLKNSIIKQPNQVYQQNIFSVSKYTPEKRGLSQSPSPFKISDLQTTQFNVNQQSLDVKNSRAYLKAMKALQNKVKEVENLKQGEIEVLKQTLQEKEEIIKKINEQLNELKVASDKMEKKLIKDTDIFTKLESNLKEKLKTVEKENDDYIQHCNFYKSEIESLKEKIGQVESLSKKEVKGLLKEKSQLKDQIHLANQEEQIYKQQIKDLQLQNKNLIQNMESLELRYRHMEQSYKNQINSSESDLNNSLKQLQLQLLEKDDQIRRLKQDNITLNSDIEITRQKYDEVCSQFEDEKRKNQHLEEENRQLSEKIQEIIRDNENMRSFCQATREMNNKLLNSFSTSRLNETQQNQIFFKSGNQNQHSFSQSGNFQASQSLSETANNQNIILIQDDLQQQQQLQQQNQNRNSSTNLLQTISNVASALPPSQKQIQIIENIEPNQYKNIESILKKDKYYINQGLTYANQAAKKNDKNQFNMQKEEPIEDNQEQKQYKYSQSNVLNSQNSLKHIQSTQISNQQRSQYEENTKSLQRQGSMNQRESNRIQRTLNFSDQKHKNSQETFRTAAQLSQYYQENNNNQQLKSRYEYEQVIQAVLDTEKNLVELNHTYQKLAEDIYNFEGDEIYITVLKKKMLDLKEKISIKQEFLEEMKTRENILAQSILTNI
ncbi:hypothetical protein TTHERM_01248840 (macronuclear) [Tetrahymena thermophila SB210]|uniref:Uncharacterized protein n=1 Tax=Tetrahymena thermophila (strain SB210) TaxID=312017 RepID=Q22AC4_TETTS|nr:hypothetical protein TTHERM_01248840 [Tetrahymena thermophila SB210]EAR82225.1 hypothetical protein TTHERM_01248840 [Tetrahymena thermophila SB210]|eukprot:XP_001029888.1 hypothetical protein TTHERM_01248840 [Tetrahymena thermophila SB210]